MTDSAFNPDSAYNPDRPSGRPTDICDLCVGTGWTSFPDPFLNGALIDGRCPACQDLTVRAEKSRWENDGGWKVGPTR